MYFKNKHTQFFKSSLLVLIGTMTFTSCKKFIEVNPPVNKVDANEVFATDGTATSAITGIYSEMMAIGNQFTASSVTIYTGMYADELTHNNPTPRVDFLTNQILIGSHNLILSNFWESAYKYIYVANLSLEKLAKSESLTASVKSRLTGECLFIRSFCYFHLINLFGDVPYTRSSDYKINMILPRTSVDEIYGYIIEDLKSAKELLDESYPSDPERIRPNKWTAVSLLARVYLYTKNWLNAETEATSIINSPLYNLSQPELVFDKNSRETIWQLFPVNPNINTWEGSILLPGTTSLTFILQPGLINSFETNDRRKAEWTNSRQARYYPFKYRNKATDPMRIEYYIVFRLAELYLIRAESRANQNKISEAIADIDKIRIRAGLPGTTANAQATILSAIEQERKVELFAEWGHRWYDLKRTGKADEVLSVSALGKNWQPTDKLWPIPASQLLLNPALTQNPGY